MNNTEKTRIISLTDARPVTIKEDDWPVIAHGQWYYHDGQVECQANRRWQVDIVVRHHEDGRYLIYGVYKYTTNWQHDSNATHRVGKLLDTETAEKDSALISAITTTGTQLIERLDIHHDDTPRVRECIDACIQELPAIAI